MQHRHLNHSRLTPAAIADRLGAAETAKALEDFDRLYPQPNGESALQQLIAQLSDASPYDLAGTNLNTSNWTRCGITGKTSGRPVPITCPLCLISLPTARIRRSARTTRRRHPRPNRPAAWKVKRLLWFDSS